MPMPVDVIASACLSPIAEVSSSVDSGISSASPEPPHSMAPFLYGGGRRRQRLDSYPPIVEDTHLEQIIG